MEYSQVTVTLGSKEESLGPKGRLRSSKVREEKPGSEDIGQSQPEERHPLAESRPADAPVGSVHRESEEPEEYNQAAPPDSSLAAP